MRLRHAFVVLWLCASACSARAQVHARIYAVVLANDEPRNFLGGSSVGSGLFQSDDTGRSWKQLGWNHLKAFSMDADPRSNGRVLYIAAGNGILKSTDGGAAWSLKSDWRMAEVLDVAVSPRKSSIVIAATAHGVWRSLDSGETWERSHNGIPVPYCSRVRFDPSNPRWVLLAAEAGAYISQDEGENWRRMEGSTTAVRDLARQETGEWIAATEGNGILIAKGRARKFTTLDTSSALFWSVSTGPQGVVVAGYSGITQLEPAHAETKDPVRVSSVLQVGNKLIAATLGDGVWLGELTSTGILDISQKGLPYSQVWTLKAVEIVEP